MGLRLTHKGLRPYASTLVGLMTVATVFGAAAKTAWADDIPQEVFPDPQGELQLFDAAGNPVDYRKLNKITDPYNQNVLKGDFPIDGKHLYFNLNLVNDATWITGRTFLQNAATGNAAVNQFDFPFFNNVTTGFEFFEGTTQVFEPKRWDVKFTPVFNYNEALGNNFQPFLGYQEAFLAVKLADLSPFFDFAQVQLGVQGIKNDFEGFVYNDQNLAGQINGTLNANETNFALFYADRVFKDVASGLNTGIFNTGIQDAQQGLRNDQVSGLNYVIRDIRPGLDLNLLYANNRDTQLGAVKANKLNPNAGVNANYFGAAVQGVIGRLDVSSGAYYVTGSDANNLLTGTPQSISAGMGFLKLDYPINFWKPHMAFLWASGDTNPGDGTANGWDSINDASNFFGGQFSFFEGNNLPGVFNGKVVFLTRGNSVFPSLRNGNQPSNFVNPGLVAFNAGIDFQLHPKVTLFTNYNSFSVQSNTSTFGAIDPRLPALLSNHIADEFNFGLFIRPGLADDFVINTGVSFTSFDPSYANALYGGNGNVASFILRLTTTY